MASIEQGVDLGRASKVADRNPGHIVRVKAHRAAAKTQMQVWVVVLGLGDESHGVDEVQSALEIRKFKAFFQRAVDQFPALWPLAVELRQSGDDLGGRQSPSCGLGCLTHGLVTIVCAPILARRSDAGGCE